MEKAKIGDQRFKRPSRIPYVVAGLSFLFFISCLVFVMLTLTRPRQRGIGQEILPTPTLNQAEIQALAQTLWAHPNPLPAYLKIESQPRPSMDDIQICVVIFFDPTVLERGGGIYTLHGFAIDGIDEPGGVLGVRTHEDGRLAVRACVAHPLASGVHLVELRVDLHDAGVIFHQWAIRVD